MLTACGNKKDSNNGKTSDGKTAIRFATWDVADDVDAQQKLVDKFNEEHDDIEVTLEAYGTEHKNKIVQALEKAGCRPKVIRASL